MGKKSKLEIPTNEIKFGIIRSLRSSQRLRKIAESILAEKEQLGEVTIITHDRKYAVVFFYYAVEELGKAILLQEMKNDAEVNNQLMVDATNLFKDHDIKIKKAQERYPDLRVHKLKFEPIKNKPYGNLVPDGEIVSGFVDRSELWLVTYNPTTEKWEDHLEEIDEHELKRVIDRLGTILRDWQKSIVPNLRPSKFY